LDATKFNNAIVAGNRDAVEAALKVSIKNQTRAAEKGIIHKNNAANKKSRLMKKLNKVVV